MLTHWSVNIAYKTWTGKTFVQLSVHKSRPLARDEMWRLKRVNPEIDFFVKRKAFGRGL